MKTKIAMLIALLFAVKISTNAQQGMQRRTVEERIKSTMDKLTTPLNLDTAVQAKTTAVFTDFYTAQDKMREDARASGNRPDRSAMEKMMNDRDEKLKAIFTNDQYKKFKDEVEPTLRPQRQQGSGIQSSGS
jgi:protein CpxP